MGKGCRARVLPFFLGWWGFPFGLIYPPMCVVQNLSCGKDVTAEVSPMFRLTAAATVARSAGLPPASFG